MLTAITNTNRHKPQTSFKAQITPSAAQAKYFYRGYPLLGKFIPQHCFGFLEYDNTKFSRYMLTTGCSVCSKLSMYDKIKKIGFFAHVDSERSLLESLNDIKDEIVKRKINPENLVGIDKPGLSDPSKAKQESVKRFFQELGLKDENIYQPSVESDTFDGGILDLKDGQIYDLNSWICDYKDYRDQLKYNIEQKLADLAIEKQKALEQLNIHYNDTYSIFSQKYTQV